MTPQEIYIYVLDNMKFNKFLMNGADKSDGHNLGGYTFQLEMPKNNFEASYNNLIANVYYF